MRDVYMNNSLNKFCEVYSGKYDKSINPFTISKLTLFESLFEYNSLAIWLNIYLNI